MDLFHHLASAARSPGDTVGLIRHTSKELPMVTPQWRKASFSGTNGSCVELAPADDIVLMRDSKDPTGPVLRLTRGQLAQLLTDAKAGALDHLAR